MKSISLLKEARQVYLKKLEERVLVFKNELRQIEETEMKMLEKPEMYVNASQQKRADLVLKEMVDMSFVEFRALISLLKDRKLRSLNYQLTDADQREIEQTDEDYWPPNHPVNLEFQDEIKAKGIIGLHGYPKEFMDSLLSGKMFGHN